MAEITRQVSNGWQVVSGEDINKYGMAKMAEDDKYPPVAIVGIGVRSPGATSVDEFRHMLIEKLQTYGEIPADRWSKEEWYREGETAEAGFTNSHVAGFIPGLWEFDNGFFNTSPKEALSMDPQQYHVMEVTQEAMHDAGMTSANIPVNTGVYMSMKMGEQTLVCAENPNILNPYILTGGAHTVTANRVNFFYDISGPSMGVEGACGAAVHSIHFGVWALWNKECDAMIVGGVNHVLSPHFSVQQCDLGFLSPSGNCSPFDANSDGRVRAEGCGVIILKTLDDAIKNNDHVYACIRASALGYHGKQMNLQDHTSEGINNVISPLYDRFGIKPDDIDYVECNATGNTKEDFPEFEAVDLLHKERKNAVRVGSVKGNVGHQENASGMMQTIKCALMLDHEEFYSQKNFSKKHTTIEDQGWRLQVQDQYEKYDKEKNMMVAVNTTAFTGQVCHLVLESYRPQIEALVMKDLAGWTFGGNDSGIMIPITITAKTKNALKDLARKWLDFEHENDAMSIAGWLSTRRDHYVNRLCVTARSSDHFRECLRKYIEGTPCDDVTEGAAPNKFEAPKICFVFPGQGQQWWNMGRELYATEPLYRDIVDRCDVIWEANSGYSFKRKDGLFVADPAGLDPERIEEIIVCQPAIVSHQIGLATLLMHWGVIPDIVLGHSLGEVATAYMAGTMTLEEAITSIHIRATSQSKLTGSGHMAAARYGPEAAEKMCAGYDDVFVACYNSTENVTIAGARPIMRQLAEEQPTKLKIIRVQAAFHTVLVNPVKDEFYERMQGKYTPKPCKDEPIMYSTVVKDKHKGPCDPDYWWNNISCPVFFVQANKALFRDYGDNVVFVEIASAATLMSSIRQTAKTCGVSPKGYVACGLRGKDDRFAALKGVSQLYAMGFDINWANVTKNCSRYTRLPKYPFQSVHYRLEASQFTNRRLGREDKSYVGRNGEISCNMHPFLADYLLEDKARLPSSGSLEYLAELVADRVVLKDITIHDNPVMMTAKENIICDFLSLWVDSKITGDEVALRRRDDLSRIATAYITSGGNENIPASFDLQATRSRCSTSLDADEFYKNLAVNGLSYGESFKIMNNINLGSDEAITSLKPEENKYERLKTVSLDGCFQLAMASFGSGSPALVKRIKYLEMLVDRLPMKQDLNAVAILVDWTPSAFIADLYLTDEEGGVLVALKGVCFEISKSNVTNGNLLGDLYTTKLEKVGIANKEVPKTLQVITSGEYTTLVNELKSNISGAVSTSLKELKSVNEERLQGATLLYIWSPKPSKNRRVSRNEANVREGELDQLIEVIEYCQMAARKADFTLWVVSISDAPTTADAMATGYLRSVTSSLSLRLNQLSLTKPDSGAIIKAICTDSNATEYIGGTSGLSNPIVRHFTTASPAPTGAWDLSLGSSSTNNGYDHNEANFCKMDRDWLNKRRGIHEKYVKEEVKKSTVKNQISRVYKAKEIRPLKSGYARIAIQAIGTTDGVIQCAGIVTDVGSDMKQFKTGDEVIALRANTLTSSLVSSERNLVAKPSKLSWAEASCFGLTYGTAYHTLVDMAEIQDGDTVFVHPTDNALGQAVVQIARLMGAKVICSGNASDLISKNGIVTVVNPNSITLTRDILQHTGGRGVDIVVDTSGASMSQELMGCVAEDGKICLITLSGTKLADFTVSDSITTIVVDGSDLLNRNRECLKESLKEVSKLVSSAETGSAQLAETSLANMKTPLSNTIQVTTVPEGFVPNKVEYGNLGLLEDATYVVTCSSNLLSQALVGWLSERGARHLALISDGSGTALRHRLLVAGLKSAGVKVYEKDADLTKPDEVKQFMRYLETEGAPCIKGIFYVGLPSPIDTHLRQASDTVNGATNLHNELQSRNVVLDHFVVFSDADAMVGCAKSTDAVAAACAMDSFITEIKNAGLPGLSLKIGAILGSRRGTFSTPLPVDNYLSTLDVLLQDPSVPATVCAAQMYWTAAVQNNARNKHSFEHFVETSYPAKALDIMGEEIADQVIDYLLMQTGWSADYFDYFEKIPMTEYGVECYLLREMNVWLQKRYNVAVTRDDLESGLTAEGLVERIQKACGVL